MSIELKIAVHPNNPSLSDVLMGFMKAYDWIAYSTYGYYRNIETASGEVQLRSGDYYKISFWTGFSEYYNLRILTLEYTSRVSFQLGGDLSDSIGTNLGAVRGEYNAFIREGWLKSK